VELQLGHPVTSVTLPEGKRVDVYEYEIGNEPSAGRAIGHGVMDVLTFGAWEIIGTPVEGVIGEKKSISIIYSKNDCVESINESTVAKKESVKDEKKQGE